MAGVAATISVRDLRKSYGPVKAVDGVSFEVQPGEFFGILGPNGAGKTTTLEIVEGLREADSGEVTVLGLPAWPRNPALLPRIGVQLQASSFFERLTAREQLQTFASLYGVPARRADVMLGVVGLEEQAGTRTEKLSGGQAQRLSIACALVHDPEVVFLDEPTGALDPQARRNLWDLLRQISAEGRTVVLTTHHMDEAETLCDRVAIMDHGVILEEGPPAALVRRLDQPLRVSVESGLLPADDARALAARAGAPPESVTDDGVSLTIATRDPAAVLAGLADRARARGPARVRRHAGGRVPASHRAGVPRMTAFRSLSRAMFRGFVRDRAALVFSILIPVLFLVLFGSIYKSSTAPKVSVIEVGRVSLLDQAVAGSHGQLGKVMTHHPGRQPGRGAGGRPQGHRRRRGAPAGQQPGRALLDRRPGHRGRGPGRVLVDRAAGQPGGDRAAPRLPAGRGAGRGQVAEADPVPRARPARLGDRLRAPRSARRSRW